MLAYLKFQSKISKSLQQILRLLQLNLFTRRSLIDLLQHHKQGGLSPPQLKFGLVRN
jgi:putative transposase